MSGMQWIKFTEHHANAFLSAGNSARENGVAPPVFARWGFDFGEVTALVIPLVIPLASATCCRVQTLLLNRGFEIVERYTRALLLEKSY